MPRRLPMGAFPRHDGVDLGQTSVVRGARRLAIICARGNADESLVKTLQKEAAADRSCRPDDFYFGRHSTL